MVAFLICGLVPMAPYLVGTEDGFLLSSILTGLVFFGIGSAKSRWSTRSWWRQGLETLLIGGCAATLAYFAGALLKEVVG